MTVQFTSQPTLCHPLTRRLQLGKLSVFGVLMKLPTRTISSWGNTRLFCKNELRTLGTDITFGRYGGKNVLAIGMSGGAKTKLTMLPPVIHHGRSIFQEIFRNDKGIVNPHSGSLLAEIDTEDLSGGVKTGEAKIGATYLLEYGANRHVPQRVILLRIIGHDPSNYIDIRWKRLDIVGLGVTR